MVTSFFCQNLLSDYIEGLLPTAREKEVKDALDGCVESRALLDDLRVTLDILNSLPSVGPGQGLLERAEQAVSGKTSTTQGRLSKVAMLVLAIALPLGIYFGFIRFNDLRELASLSDEGQGFVRYYPLYQGAAQLLEEQAAWIQNRDFPTGSVWEEGGLSPEEFEKVFELQAAGMEAK